jgi:hypothetical protein
MACVNSGKKSITGVQIRSDWKYTICSDEKGRSVKEKFSI